MVLFQDQKKARNRYEGDNYPLREDASRGLCYFVHSSIDLEYLREISRKMFQLPYCEKGDPLTEGKAERLAVELATFSYQGIMSDFGKNYLKSHIKKDVKISDRNLAKFNLEQRFIASYQDNPTGSVSAGVNLDSRYGITLNYGRRPIAIMGLYVDEHANRGVISQLQGISDFDRGISNQIKRKIRWAPALVNFAIDWFAELGVNEISIQSVKNNHWAQSTFSQLVSLGLPVTDFEEAMHMDTKELRGMAYETLVKKKEEIWGVPMMCLPSDGFMLYDVTARRARWKGKKFEQRKDGNYYLQLQN